MYLRWKKKTRRGKNTNSTINFTLSPVIVESYWHGGRAKQRVLKYLGSIRENNISYIHTRERFWNQVNSNLQSLKLTRQQRASFAAQIQEIVPNPSAEPKAPKGGTWLPVSGAAG